MKVAALHTPPTEIQKTDLDYLKKDPNTNLEKEKARLKKAAKEFESFFTYQLLKTMRKTIPKNNLTEGGAFSGGMGKDIFTDMFDMHLSKEMTGNSDKSISAILYKSLEKIIEAPFKNDVDEIHIKPLEELQKKPIEIEQDQIELEKPKEHFEIDHRPGDFMNVTPPIRSKESISQDPILSKYGSHIQKAADKYSVDPALIISVIKSESNGDQHAVSPAGAKGLMQLIDTTATDMQVKDVFNAEQNIDGGTRYLKSMLDRFKSVKLALAAYNAGPGNVMRYDGIPPFPETEAYVEKVMGNLAQFDSSTTSNDAKAK